MATRRSERIRERLERSTANLRPSSLDSPWGVVPRRPRSVRPSSSRRSSLDSPWGSVPRRPRSVRPARRPLSSRPAPMKRKERDSFSPSERPQKRQRAWVSPVVSQDRKRPLSRSPSERPQKRQRAWVSPAVPEAVVSQDRKRPLSRSPSERPQKRQRAWVSPNRTQFPSPARGNLNNINTNSNSNSNRSPVLSPKPYPMACELRALAAVKKVPGYRSIRQRELYRVLNRPVFDHTKLSDNPTVCALKARARFLRLKGYSRMGKARLLELLDPLSGL